MTKLNDQLPDQARFQTTCNACDRKGTNRTMHQLHTRWYCNDSEACLADVQRSTEGS